MGPVKPEDGDPITGVGGLFSLFERVLADSVSATDVWPLLAEMSLELLPVFAE
jgi:hypothetical protein